MISEKDGWIKKAHDTLFPLWSETHVLFPLVPFSWIIAFVSVENMAMNSVASRLESHVINEIKLVKASKKSFKFPGFNDGPIYRAIIKYKEDSVEFQSIGTSWGLLQIMGYNLIVMGYSPEQYIQHTLKNSLHVSAQWVQHKLLPKAKTLASALRLHNTGSVFGATYDPNYVPAAVQVERRYLQLYPGGGKN